MPVNFPKSRFIVISSNVCSAHPFVDDLFYIVVLLPFYLHFQRWISWDGIERASELKGKTFLRLAQKELKLIKIFHLLRGFSVENNEQFATMKLLLAGALCAENNETLPILIRYLIANFMAIIGLYFECK